MPGYQQLHRSTGMNTLALASPLAPKGIGFWGPSGRAPETYNDAMALAGCGTGDRSQATQAGLNALLLGLDGLAHGVAVLDAQGVVHYANAAARSVMKQRAWLVAHGQALGRVKVDDPTCLEAVRRVCDRGLRQMLDLPLPQDHRSPVKGLGRCFVALVPAKVGREVLAFITFGRAELCGPIELQMFAQQHALTNAESAVLRQLCQGLTAVQIASANGVATCTALSQVSAIREKTGFASVRRLLDALSRMPPLNPLAVLETSG
jgi:DNA-binding CsgD family transcriptional regulator